MQIECSEDSSPILVPGLGLTTFVAKRLYWRTRVFPAVSHCYPLRFHLNVADFHLLFVCTRDHLHRSCWIVIYHWKKKTKPSRYVSFRSLRVVGGHSQHTFRSITWNFSVRPDDLSETASRSKTAAFHWQSSAHTKKASMDTVSGLGEGVWPDLHHLARQASNYHCFRPQCCCRDDGKAIKQIFVTTTVCCHGRALLGYVWYLGSAIRQRVVSPTKTAAFGFDPASTSTLQTSARRRIMSFVLLTPLASSELGRIARQADRIDCLLDFIWAPHRQP